MGILVDRLPVRELLTKLAFEVIPALLCAGIYPAELLVESCPGDLCWLVHNPMREAQ